MSEKWQPIETAPKDGGFVLLAVPGLAIGPVTLGHYWRNEERDEATGRFQKGQWFRADFRGWLDIDGDNLPSWCEPTHWMPLPQTPEQEAKEVAERNARNHVRVTPPSNEEGGRDDT